MKNQVTIEKKITSTFTVAGIEFDNLKTAQFFVRYVTAVQARVTQSGKLFYVSDVLNEMRTFTNADAADLDDEDVVAYVMALQMPKPARKKNPQAFQRRDFKTFPKKNVQALAGDGETFDQVNRETAEQQKQPMLNTKGEFNFDTIPDGLDTTFALRA